MTHPDPPRTVARRTFSTIAVAIVICVVVALVFVGLVLVVDFIRRP